jgi:hypothetical protein
MAWRIGIMPTRDLFHDAVKHGLIKDGWTITADPLIVVFAGLNMHVDSGDQKLIAAEKDDHQIAVEVNSFLGPSLLTEFHRAVGKFATDRIALNHEEPQRSLYMAVPTSTYSAFFVHPFAQDAVQRNSLHLIVYDPEAEALVRWVN